MPGVGDDKAFDIVHHSHAALLSSTPYCQFFLLRPEIIYSSIPS